MAIRRRTRDSRSGKFDTKSTFSSDGIVSRTILTLQVRAGLERISIPCSVKLAQPEKYCHSHPSGMGVSRKDDAEQEQKVSVDCRCKLMKWYVRVVDLIILDMFEDIVTLYAVSFPGIDIEVDSTGPGSNKCPATHPTR